MAHSLGLARHSCWDRQEDPEWTVAQKQAFYAALVANLDQRLGLGPAEVRINLFEVAPENWPFGHGRAQYVEGD